MKIVMPLFLLFFPFCFSAHSAELNISEQKAFKLNDLDPKLCTKEANMYDKVNQPRYYACDRTRKVLYGQGVDLTKIESGNPDKPAANIIGPGTVDKGVNVFTSYIVEPPLQNKPEAGFEDEGSRGIDWGSADALVRSAARNLIQDVTDTEGNTVTYPDGRTVPNHGISHAFIGLRCEGLPPLLTGMSTGKDIESPVNFFVHNLGLGILFRTQVGRVNTYEELKEEIDIRKEKAGDLTYVDYKITPENCRYIYYSIKEMFAEGIQKRYGSLTDRLLNGTGMGCAMFDVGVKQMAQVIPIRAEEVSPDANSCEFHRRWRRTIHVPKDYLPQYDEKSQLLSEAKIGLITHLLSGDDAQALVYWVDYILNSLIDKLEDSTANAPTGYAQHMQTGVETLAKILRPLIRIAKVRASAFQLGIQRGLYGKQFIQETLLPVQEGYPWASEPGENTEELTFWDPQLYATWTREVHDDLNADYYGEKARSEINCYNEKQYYKAVSDGLAVGLEIDYTHVKPLQESIFLKTYDYARWVNGEDVDPFKEYDGQTDAIPVIFDFVKSKL